MNTVDMRISKRVHKRVMQIARERHIRAWKALESLIPAALLEIESSSIQQKPKDAQKPAKVRRVLLKSL